MRTLSLQRAFEDASAALGLRRPRVRLVAAVSGGADSVALLHLLADAPGAGRRALVAAHLDHGIRGREAEADAAFVRERCEKLGVPLIEERADVPALAKRERVSIEMAARRARYAFFGRALESSGAAAVVTAHTADDQAETVLLRLARGAGPAGLGGMRMRETVEGVAVVRPLLRAWRADVLEYLQARGLSWREDSSNRDDAHRRNRVRHEVIPLLERRLNPGVRVALVRAAEIMAADEAWIEGLLDEARRACEGQGGALLGPRLARFPVAVRRRVLRGWLGRSGLPPDRIDFAAVEALDALAARRRGSAAIDLPEGLRAVNRYGELALEGRGAPAPADGPFALALPGDTLVPPLGVRIVVRRTRGYAREPGPGAGRLPARAFISAAAVGAGPLAVRGWRRGDRMVPLGMEGPRKLHDILVDAKVPRDRRGRVPVLVCRGEIVWVAGYRVARAWAVPDGRAASLEIRTEPLAGVADSMACG